MNPFAKFFCGLLLCCFAAFAQAAAKAKSPPFSTSPVVQAFIAEMHAQHGFDPGLLTRQFSAIRPNATVLRAIRPAAVPDLQRSWQRYRERFVNERRV